MGIIMILFIFASYGKTQTAGTLFLDKKILVDTNNFKNYFGIEYYQDTSVNFEIPDNYYIERILINKNNVKNIDVQFLFTENFIGVNYYGEEMMVFDITENLQDENDMIHVNFLTGYYNLYYLYYKIEINDSLKFRKKIYSIITINESDFPSYLNKEIYIKIKLIRFIKKKKKNF